MTTLLHAGLTYLQQNVICSCISARTHHCMPHDLCNFLGKLWKSRQLPRLKQLCFFGLTLVALCLGFTESPVSFPKAPATLGTVWYFLLCSPNSTVPSAPTNTAWRSIWIHRYSDGSVPIFLFLLFFFSLRACSMSTMSSPFSHTAAIAATWLLMSYSNVANLSLRYFLKRPPFWIFPPQHKKFQKSSPS